MSTREPAGGVMPIAARALTRPAWNSVPNQVLFLLCLMYFIFYIDRVNISTAAPLIQKDLGLSNTALGFAFSAFAYPYAVFQLIGGWLGDKFGPRLTLGVSGLGTTRHLVAAKRTSRQPKRPRSPPDGEGGRYPYVYDAPS
jgi:nitrate/nitrite transporter NarK